MYLHPLPDDAGFVYCGPAVLAALTGKHPHIEVRAAINRVRRRDPTRPVKGMTNSEVEAALRLMDVPCGVFCRGQYEMLRTFVERRPSFVGVVSVTGHLVCVSTGLCLDSMSRFAVPVARFKGNRKLVRSYIAVLDEDGPYEAI